MSRRPPKSAARGIAPDLLLSQVRSTAPYLFEDLSGDPALAVCPPVVVLRELASAPLDSLAHADYFRLCLAAHYATCATPVPTDVDNQIRRKLWPPGLPLVTALEMARLVLESHGWDFTPLTSRTSYGAAGTEWAQVPLHGHLGEWFTVASAAYAALALYKAQDAKRMREALLDAIARETERHSEVFGSVWRAKDGLGALMASVSIAHDFGDLDRVIDMWALPITDPLRLRFHELTARAFDPEQNLRHMGRLWAAGELYKSVIDGSSMALENHRHFALRKPRALRSLPALRVPIGPFFDRWGDTVASTLEGDDLRETVEALAHGAERMPSTQGYLRALHAIRAHHPELVDQQLAPIAKTPRVRAALATAREEFEARWSTAALALLDDIPSRAR